MEQPTPEPCLTQGSHVGFWVALGNLPALAPRLCLCRAGGRVVAWGWPLKHTAWATKAIKQEGVLYPGPRGLFKWWGFLAFLSSGVFCTNLNDCFLKELD